jgi:OmpA-OmpF porin, OOP family
MRRGFGAAAASTLFITSVAALLPTVAQAYEPGWYFGAGGSYHSLEDSDGTLRIADTTVTPGEVVNEPCPVSSIPVIGGPLNDGLSGLAGVEQGCLLLLFGPGTQTQNPDGTTTETFPAQPTRITFDGGFGINASVGYLFEGGFRPELQLSYSEADIRAATQGTPSGTLIALADAGKLRANRLIANLWYDIDFGGRVVPYIGIGGGFQRTKLDLDGASESSSGAVFNAGAGIGFWINPRTALSLDYRYVVADDFEYRSSTQNENVRRDTRLKSEYRAHDIGLGLRFAFGEGGATDSDGDGVPDRDDKCPNTPPGVQVDARGCPLDSDGDGVPDHLDQCPNTPAGVQVDARGCPLDSDGDGVPDYLDKCPGTPPGTRVGPDGCSLLDSDGDGVPDELDKCPDTPAGIAVGPDGCPLDSDGDGIPDYLDECPNSPPGARVLPNGCALEGDCRKPRPGEQVDARGCAVEQSFILRGVKFDFDSDRLTPAAREILNEVAATLQAYRNIDVELEGHTDSIGSDNYNLGLSERRANAVKVYLESRGVPGRRMRPVGYGQSRPIASNETEDGREENRRVELRVVE